MIRSPRRTRTEIVGRFRVFEVERHDMVGPDGEPTRDVYTFTCPDWCSVVPVTNTGDVVLVRQYRHGIDGPTLEVPGGVIDAGEPPISAAARELREETGYACDSLELVGAGYPNPPLQDNRHHIFLGRGARLVAEPELDEGEHCEVVLLPLADVERMAWDGRIEHELVAYAMLRAFRAITAR